MTVAEKVRRCRTELGLTQEQLAKRLGVTSRAVQAWEAGARFPGLRAQRALGEVFGRQPDYFKDRGA